MMKATLRSVALIALLSLTACSSLQDRDDTVGWSPQKIYETGKEALDEGNFEKAIKYFERLEARYPYGRHAQQAQLETAYAYYKSEEPEQAIAAADRFIRLHPDHPNVDYAYYLKGLATFNADLGLLGRLANVDLAERDPKGARESFEAFKTLVTRFPDSRYAADSRKRLQYLINALGRHETLVARYYLSRHAYVAAINRAQTALKEFPDTPAQEDALGILVHANQALGLNEASEDARRVLTLNYPDSPWLKGIPDIRPAWWKFWN